MFDLISKTEALTSSERFPISKFNQLSVGYYDPIKFALHDKTILLSAQQEVLYVIASKSYTW